MAMFPHPCDAVVTTQAVSAFRPAILTGDMLAVSYGSACVTSFTSAPSIFLSL